MNIQALWIRISKAILLRLSKILFQSCSSNPLPSPWMVIAKIINSISSDIDALSCLSNIIRTNSYMMHMANTMSSILIVLGCFLKESIIFILISPPAFIPIFCRNVYRGPCFITEIVISFSFCQFPCLSVTNIYCVISI